MTSPSQIRAADAVARRLYAAGCRHAFGMPGGEVLTMVDALAAAGIEFVLCKHENAAGFMAEAAWQATGAPGIMVATLGPGVLNGVNVIANAWQDRVPMVVLSGCADGAETDRYTHQIVDHQAVFQSITKATLRLKTGSAWTIADKAVTMAMEGSLGPVHIDVPIGVADSLVPATAPALRPAAAPTVPAPGTLAQAQSWLKNAKRTVILAGIDAFNQRAEDAITRFAETHQIPVLTTYKSKGLIAEDHPMSLGGFGLSPLADTHLVPFVQAADVVLLVGYDPVEVRPGWRDVWDLDRQKVIDITAAPNHHYMHQASLNLIADCAATLDALSGPDMRGSGWPVAEIDAVRAALAKDFPTDDPWGPAAIMDTCRTALPRNAIATADSGAHRILLSQMWPCYEPRTMLQSAALCTMGCAMPLAMGAKLCAPSRQVVSFSGDAGFLMITGELATAAELKLNVIFVVFVDASLALIELKQRGRQMRNVGVDFGKHDYAAMGRAFGGAGHHVTDRAGLQAALEAAQTANTFTVIACEIEKGAYDGRI